MTKSDIGLYLGILIVDILPIIVIIIAVTAIVRAIKRSSDRNYELRKYQAETERIKAQAAQFEKENK